MVRQQLAVRGVYPHLYRTLNELYRALKTHVHDAAILGITGPTGEPIADAIRHLRRLYPILHLVVYLEPEAMQIAHWPVQLFAAAKAGADACVMEVTDACTAVQDHLVTGTYESVVLRQITNAARERMSATVWTFVQAVVKRGRRAPTVEDLTGRLRMSRQSLARECRVAGLPTPREFIAWCRLLLAAAMLDQPGLTAEQIGTRVFGSPAGYRNMLRRW